MITELRKKIDFDSKATIREFSMRNKLPRADPHYKNQQLDPIAQLSADDIEALKLFLPFFL